MTSMNLESLQVIDRLEVGPAQLKTDALRALYTLHRDGTTASIELSYKWATSVFKIDEWASKNLGALIAAQVAMNYGLFCREIVLHGPFDKADKRFLSDVLENTSREIYVNKLLESTPFLLPPWNTLMPEKKARYTQATLHLTDVSNNDVQKVWGSEPKKHAVLLSGGKDSLLTHAMLQEIGMESHPIFVNESGRHWYTALNAYRHFQKEVPHTARVWTNADRIFTWMLRQLPFIRSDFSRVRADIYPIRLWTVAVFLFGALPLLRAKGIGRLLIGDEFDTTVKAQYEGIPHYAGLYDQSRYFDNALTRFFAQKGWHVTQFSILRPLSELLIQKMLTERYPKLQALQVSCHAAHIIEDRVYPCGRCEKCHRIVGMLLAFGQDPTRCGYTKMQIDKICESLPWFSLHQEAEGAAHLRHLLIRKQLIDPGELIGVDAALHEEVVRLRFDKKHAPIDLLPQDLRAPLYRVMLEHAKGAVKREGRRWMSFDPLEEDSLSIPYPFTSSVHQNVSSSKSELDTRYQLGELTWQEAKAKLKEVDIALFPVGSIEQHGPHLPLDVDAFDAAKLCADVASACSDPKPFVLPLLPYGVSYHHDEFPGTLSISPATLAQVTVDVVMSAARHGITKLIIINGHGGNGPALHFAAQMINRDAHIFTCVDTGETSDVEIARLTTTLNDVHAGEVETSTTLALRPHLVKMALAKKSVPRFSSDYLEFSSQKSIEWYVRTRQISKNGVLGDPTKASAEKGKKMWDIMVRNLVRLVEDLKGLTLDEIYQKRY